MAHMSLWSTKLPALRCIWNCLPPTPKAFVDSYRRFILSIFHLANFRTLQPIQIILKLESAIYDISHLSYVYVIWKLSKFTSPTSLKKEDIVIFLKVLRMAWEPKVLYDFSRLSTTLWYIYYQFLTCLEGNRPFENLMKVIKCTSVHNFTINIGWLMDPYEAHPLATY